MSQKNRYIRPQDEFSGVNVLRRWTILKNIPFNISLTGKNIETI